MKKNHTILLLLLLSGPIVKAQLIAATGNLNSARIDFSSQLLANGKVLALGGNNGDVLNFVAYTSAELYDPISGTWTYTGSMNVIRDKASSILLDNGNVLTVGGEDDFGTERSSCEIYNVSTGTWSYTGSLTFPRTATRLVKLTNGKILAVGGEYNNSCELYDQVSNTWSATASMNINRARGHDALKLPNGKVLLVGGDRDSAELYDETSGTWTKIQSKMITERDEADAILMANGKVLISGGGITSEIYDPLSNTFTATGSALSNRWDNEMINLDNGNVLVYGLGDIFEFNDKKTLEVYSVFHGGWSSAGKVTTQFFGSNGYAIHELQNGKIFLAGGSFTGANGASPYSYLVNQSSITGLKEAPINEIPGFTVYPNPSSGQFTLQADLPLTGKAEVKIYNINGQLVYSQTLQSGSIQETISVKDLAKGVYQLKLVSGDQVANKRVIVQ